MKFSITKDQFLSGLQAVQNLIGTRATIPILSNIVLRAGADGKLRLTASDLDVSITTTVQAGVTEPGETTLPAKKLYGIVRELSRPELTLVTNDKDVATIQSGKACFKLNGLPAAEYPPGFKVEPKKNLLLTQDRLRQMLKMASSCSSTEVQAKFILTGVFLELRNKTITAVGVNGYTMCVVPEPIAESGTIHANIPAKAVQELIRSLREDEDVAVSIADNAAQFLIYASESGPEIEITTKLIEGRFPDYTRIIPTETQTSIEVNREELKCAIGRAAMVSDAGYDSLVFKLAPDELSISVFRSNSGGSHEVIPARCVGMETELMYSHIHLGKLLSIIDDDEVTLKIANADAPAGPNNTVINSKGGATLLSTRMSDPTKQPAQ